jgi:hypothetical protein
MVVKCMVCNGKINSDAFRCPEGRSFLHTGFCMKKHVRKCLSYHRKIRWRKKADESSELG